MALGKIETRKGDLLEATECYIVHGVNCQGVMNSGVAKQIRQKWPKAYDEYVETCTIMAEAVSPSGRSLSTKSLLGTVQLVNVDEEVTVVNAFTQLNYGRNGSRYVSYDAVASCFEILNKCIDSHGGFNTVAFPKIGAGLGGGNWKVISAIIEAALPKSELVLYVP